MPDAERLPPVHPYLVVRLRPGFFIREPVQPGLPVALYETIVRRRARELMRQAAVVLSPDDALFCDCDGNLEGWGSAPYMAKQRLDGSWALVPILPFGEVHAPVDAEEATPADQAAEPREEERQDEGDEPGGPA